MRLILGVAYIKVTTSRYRNKVKEFKDDVEIMKDVLPFDITQSNLFPDVYILSNEEEKEFLQKSKIQKENLSRILDTDPLCAHYLALPGEIIKIVQINGSINYKHVIHNDN